MNPALNVPLLFASKAKEWLRMPSSPIVDIGRFVRDGSGGQYLPNLASSTAVDGNLYPFNTSLIDATGFTNSAGGVFTRSYADGPRGTTLTAMRVQLTPGGSQQYVALLNSVTFAAGQYTCVAKIKSNTGAGTQTVKWGNFNIGVGSMVSSSVTEASWTTVTQTFTLGAPAQIFLLVYIASTDLAIDVLVDEIQIYSGASAPAFTSEQPNGHVVPLVRNGSNIVISGGLLDNTGGKVPGVIKFNTFPTKKSFTEGTIAVSVEITSTTSNYAKIVGATEGTGSWDAGCHLGKAYSTPSMPVSAATSSVFNNGSSIASKGVAILVTTFNSSKATFYLNGVLFQEITSGPYGPFSNRAFGFCGDPMPDNGQLNLYGVNPFLGKVGNAVIFDKAINDDQAIILTQDLATRHLQYTGNALGKFNIYNAQGDSITQGVGSFLNTYYKRFVDTLPGNWYGINSSIFGSRLLDDGTHPSLQARQATELRRIYTAKAMGHNYVCSILIGANLLPAYSDLLAYYQSMMNAGAKVIACTITPNNSSSYPTFETDRGTLNTQIISGASTYGYSIADFGSDPNIGVRTNTTANQPPNVNYQDYVHPNDTGNGYAYNVISPVISGLAVF